MIAAGQVDQLSLLLLALALGVASWWWLRERPVMIALVWILVIAFVPFWFGVTIAAYFQPASVVGVLLIACMVSVKWPAARWADVGVALFFAICLLPALFGLATPSSVFQVVTQWGVGYLVGRLLPDHLAPGRLHLVLGVVMSVVGALAVIEFVAVWNPFVDLGAPNQLYAKWSILQERGGLLRAEGAFGHSIALGACLGLTVPLVLTADVRWQYRVAMLLPVMAGAVVSFSRIGIATTLAGIVLCVLFLRTGLPARLRVLVAGAVVVGGVIATPILTSAFSEAGSEATNSAAYRGDLSSLVPAFPLVGFSDVATRTASGELYFGRFQSIDSAIVLLGLTYGWLALIVATVLLGAVGLTVVRRSASPAAIAVVAHLPALATVALITQYSMYFWFIAGLAAHGLAWGGSEPSERDGEATDESDRSTQNTTEQAAAR